MGDAQLRPNIVLVEDDFDLCLILERLLTKAGYAVTALREGREILEHSFDAPALFVLDITLPSIDGIALCKYLRVQSRFKTVPIIVVSGNHDMKHRALTAGAHTFIQKPMSIDHLLREVKSTIIDNNLPGRS